MVRALLVASLFSSSVALAQAQVPMQLVYQGRLMNAGAPASGTLSLTFTLYDAATGGTAKWTETYDVAPTDGFYAVTLGDTSGGKKALALADIPAGGMWLELKVGTTALAPRQQVGSVAYAMRAELANGLVAGAAISAGTVTATSVVVGGKTVIDSSGKVAGDAVTINTGTGSGLTGAGSTTAPLTVDLVVGAGLTGKGTQASPLQLANPSGIALGDGPSNPALNCADLLSKRAGVPSGVYWLKPSTATNGSFQAYCDMTTPSGGAGSAVGGWTLVWSNLRGGKGKFETDLPWLSAIDTYPKVRGTLSGDLESFQVYTGLKHYAALGPNAQMRYDWSWNYEQPVSQRMIATFSLNAGANYTLNLSAYFQPVGSVQAGLFQYHSGKPFSAYDKDLTGTQNCGTSYTNTPFWYATCWSGSINGGGEGGTNAGYANAAYWTSSGVGVATSASDTTRGGNGWLYVR